MGRTEIPLIVAGHERAIACPMIDSTASLVRARRFVGMSPGQTPAPSLTGEQRLPPEVFTARLIHAGRAKNVSAT